MWRDASRADQDTQGPGHLGVRWLIPLVCVLVLGLFLGLRSNLEMAVPLGSDAAMQGLLAMGLIRVNILKGFCSPNISPIFVKLRLKY